MSELIVIIKLELPVTIHLYWTQGLQHLILLCHELEHTTKIGIQDCDNIKSS